MIRFLLTLALLALNAQCADIICTNATQNEFDAKVATAADGDHVILPSTSFVKIDWTNVSTITKSIWVSGATDGSTVIGCGNTAGFGTFWFNNTVTNKKTRLSYLTLAQSSFNTNGTLFGIVQFWGHTRELRMDHMVFTNCPGKVVTIVGDVCGVFDNNTVYNTDSATTGIWFNSYFSDWGGASDPYGDAAWSAPMTWGTTNVIMIEDSNFFVNRTTDAWTDLYRGTRMGWRFNNATNGHIATHGTETGGRERGVMQMEVYNNNMWSGDAPGYTNNGFISQVFLRSGSLMQFSNVLHGFTALRAMTDFQSTYPGNFYGWNGTNLFCSNSIVQWTGTHTGPNGSLNVIDNTKTWTTDQVKWLTFQNLSITGFNCTTNMHPFALCSGNNATNATMYACFLNGLGIPCGTGSNAVWNTGDSYAAYYVIEALDSPGHGTGNLLSGDPPTPYAYINQKNALNGAGVWTWANTINSVAANGDQPNGNIIQGRHWTNGNATLLAGYTPLTYPHPLRAYQWPGETNCTYTLSYYSTNAPAAGLTGSVAITTSSNVCTWASISGDSWITITSGSSGTGNGTVGYSVAVNSGGGRSGTIAVNSTNIFTITQAGIIPPPSTNTTPIQVTGKVRFSGAIDLKTQ